MSTFPDVFGRLPEADMPIQAVIARLLQGPTACAIFVEALQETAVPEHRHGAQWGIVVDGEVDLTIDAETRTRRRGDEYFIPAGVPHKAILRKGARFIDWFDDPNRYRPKA